MAATSDLGHCSFPAGRDGLADSAGRMRQHTLREPSWLVGFVTSKVLVVEMLLAGCSIQALVDQPGTEDVGSWLSGRVVPRTRVPARGIARSEHVALLGDEVE
jgi:hypothetical protein